MQKLFEEVEMLNEGVQDITISKENKNGDVYVVIHKDNVTISMTVNKKDLLKALQNGGIVKL